MISLNTFVVLLLFTEVKGESFSNSESVMETVSSCPLGYASHNASCIKSSEECLMNMTERNKDLKIQDPNQASSKEDTLENENISCIDLHEKCNFWSNNGECGKNPKYMHKFCRKSCYVCVDDSEMEIDMGVTQLTEGAEKEYILKVIERSKRYLQDEIMIDSKYDKVRDECKNQHEMCAFWAFIGECDENPRYMKISCALACRSCDQLDASLRCARDPNAVDSLKPGDLNKLFERITNTSEASEFAKYKPVVHSRPYIDPEDANKEPNYNIGPWLITFDSFLTDEECDHMIALGKKLGYERSTNVGKLLPNGDHERLVQNSRTSENAWCTDECDKDLISRNITDRIASVTGIPETNSEYLQLLKYEVGQFYTSHHDLIDTHVDKLYGPRILTFYMYLNDVEEGGGTEFTDLDITVAAKKGRAALWPSVIDSDPSKTEYMTHHAALAVEKGVKFGANAWIHLRDFKTPNAKGC